VDTLVLHCIELFVVEKRVIIIITIIVVVVLNPGSIDPRG